MASYHRKSHGGIVFSLTLHVALVAALVVGVDMPWWTRQPPAPAPIQAEIIDAKAFEAQIKAKEDAARAAQEAERQREIEAQRQRELDAQRERDRVARAEADRQRELEQQRAAEQKRIAEQQEKERLAKEAQRLEQERIAQAEKDRLERERKEQQERERKEREERERVAREKAAAEARKAEEARLAAELAEEQRRAEEAARAAAARQTARDAYVRSITNHIEKHWSRPPNAQPGLKCVVHVRQIPSGDITTSSIVSCNGDEIVRRSIEAAVTLSSPLPTPSDPSLFERELEVVFEPVIQ